MNLAETSRGCTSPNPLVGALVVADGRILGEGHHVRPGCDHAEIAAMKDAVVRAGAGEGMGRDWLEAARKICRGATMYVTLEPCCTYGRTPPCTDALIAAEFARVVVGAIDPSPGVNGRGMELLRAAGIRVDLADGLLALRFKRQNSGLRKWVATGLPFVTYKYAMTLDGRIATDSGDSRWISSPESRALVHQWRAWSDAVVVGAGTVLADDPLLTVRDAPCERQPLRVVVDRDLRLRHGSRLAQTADQAPVLAVCSAGVAATRRAEVESWGVEVAVVNWENDASGYPVEVCRFLGERGIQTVLLEGGARLAGACWSAGIIDRLAAFICPRVVSGVENRASLIGPGVLCMNDALGLREVEVQRIGPDVLMSGYVGEAY